MTSKTTSFKAQFDRLNDISKLISDFDNLDIDSLIPLIEEANVIYNACSDRLNTIEQALDKTVIKPS